MVRQIKTYPIKKYQGTSKITVPEGSLLIGVVNKDAIGEEPVQLLVLQEVVPKQIQRGTTEIEILVSNDDATFSDISEDKALQYIGSVVWNGGYRISHVFEIEKVPEELAFLDEMLPNVETETIEFSVEDLDQIAPDGKPNLEISEEENKEQTIN